MVPISFSRTTPRAVSMAGISVRASIRLLGPNTKRLWYEGL